MTLAQINEIIKLKLVSDRFNAERNVSCACVSDILSDVMARAPRDCIWITNQSHENVIAIAFFKELTAVIFANGVVPDEESVQKANLKNITLLTCDANAFDLAGQLYHLGLRGSN